MIRLRSCAVVGLLAAAVAGLLAGDARTVGVDGAGMGGAMWSEASWPFLRDQWPNGRAFVCRAANCGIDIQLYVRPKIGFCNCATGVADDAELDRVADADLLGSGFTPLAAGRPIAVGWMQGRSRPYEVAGPAGRRAVYAIAFNDKCDVVVATIATGGAPSARMEAAALTFLNGEKVIGWAKAELGL